MSESERSRYEERPVGDHPYTHGKPASWVLVAVIIAAFCAGGAAIVAHLWWLFWLCVGVVVLSVPAGKIIGIMEDTVLVESGPRARPPVVGPGSAADPGVRMD